MTKTNQIRTKNKKQSEANRSEAEELIREYYNTKRGRVKAQELIEDYLEGREDTGERRK